MTYPQIGAFARLADGNAPKTRSIAGQTSKLGRDAHDVFYDEVNDEIVVANAFAQAIMFYRGGADGDEPPIRVIQGPKTQIQMPGYGVYVDAVHNEVFLVEGRDRPGEEYILVFPRTANGDVAPIRVIKGPDTMLKNARSMAVDSVRNLIAVTSNNGMLIFNRTDNGNVKPRAIIRGPGGNFRILESKGYIVSASGGGGGDAGDRVRGSVIRVWSITDNGNVPPLFELRNPNPGPGGGGNRVALNPKEKEVILGGAGIPESVEIYSFPEIFD